MENNNTNWCQSVTGIVIKDNKVLLARHTYGPVRWKGQTDRPRRLRRTRRDTARSREAGVS